MASVLLEKNDEIIRVDEAAVDGHVALGWSPVVNEYGKDALILHASGSMRYLYGNGLSIESLRVQHYQIAPGAVGAASVRAAATLGAAAQVIADGITNPDVARTLTVKGNVSGITGDAVLMGRNILGEWITDTIALNGTSEVEGSKAFATLEKISLPAQSHTPTAQVETATAAGTITGTGDASVVVTAAGMTGSPKTIAVAVVEDDTAAEWAAKVRAALDDDAAVTALFAVSGEGASIILTKNAPAASDSTLNISLDNGTCTGITTASSSANTTAGVPYDTVSVGRAKKFGLPQIVANAACLLVKLFDGSADDGSLAVDADIAKNLYALDGTPDGSAVDLYYVA